MSRAMYELLIYSHSPRVARVAEDVAFAARTIGLWRVGPQGLPKSTRTWKINRSPVRHSKFKDTWVLETHKQLIHIEGQTSVLNRFLDYVAATLDPIATVKVTQHRYHKIESLYSFFPNGSEDAANRDPPSLLKPKPMEHTPSQWWFDQGDCQAPSFVSPQVRVTGLTPNLSKDDVTSHFAAAGPIDHVKLALDDGEGAISFVHPLDAKKAATSLNQSVLKGQTLSVHWCEPEQQSVRS